MSDGHSEPVAAGQRGRADCSWTGSFFLGDENVSWVQGCNVEGWKQPGSEGHGGTMPESAQLFT